MLLLFLACTVGSPGPAAPGSMSAIEAEAMDDVARTAGRLANKARELETAGVEAIGAEERAAHLKELEELMAEIEALNAELQTGHDALRTRIRDAASSEDPQSTAETRE